VPEATFQPRENDLALAIETSNPSTLALDGNVGGTVGAQARVVVGVALARWRGGGWEELHTEAIAAPSPQHDDLAACVDRCAARAGCSPRDVRIVAVSAGPGGFTSVRIAIVTAKMIAEATGAACVAVPTADAVAARFGFLRGPAANFAVALASKNADAFVACYAPGAARPRLLAPGGLCDATKLARLAETHQLTHLLADRFLPPAMLEHATTLGLGIVEPVFHPLAVLDAALDHGPIDPAQLLPIYPREPEAVTKWRAMRR
jgi:tRNA threonylcarbamoyl adenosine modification protein YeaZ